MGEVKPMIAETGGPFVQRQQVQQERSLSVPVVAVKRLRYRAVWRSKQLLILPIDCHPFRKSVSAVLEDDRDRLLSCLKHSTVRRLVLSPDLPLTELLFWIELGLAAGFPIFLGLRKSRLGSRQMSLLSRCANMAGAAALFLMFSPVMLLGASLLLLFTGKVLKRDWQIGERGQFFRAFLFDIDLEQLPRWLTSMSRSDWVQLPTLLNVLRGDVALFKAQSLNQLSFRLREKPKEVTLDIGSAGRKKRELG